MVRLDDLQIFVRAAETGSFSAAARELDIAPAQASAALQRLERALGVRLFVRSTRRMRLSEDGERYLPHARAALSALASGEQVLSEGREEIAGVLKISAPSDLGRNVLLPWLDAFQARHPRLTLQLRISDRMADLFRQPVDVAIRYGVLEDSSLVSLALAPDNRRVVCAAPAYLARMGAPGAPADLGKHNCLCYVMDDHVHDRWSFELPSGACSVRVGGDRISDDADVVRRWALAGAGLIYKSRVDVIRDLNAGRLVEVFPSTWGQRAPLQMVFAHRASLTTGVQHLRDFLGAQLRELIAIS